MNNRLIFARGPRERPRRFAETRLIISAVNGLIVSDEASTAFCGRSYVGRATAHNWALTAGGIRLPHAADNMRRRA